MSAAVAPPPPPPVPADEIFASSVVTKCNPAEPSSVNVDVATFQIDDGKSEKRDDDADRTELLVLVLIFEARDDDACKSIALVLALMTETADVEAASTVALVLAFTAAMTVVSSGVVVLIANVLSSFTKSTPAVPHDISAGHTPRTEEPANV